jgi:hypothetical protein
LDDDEEEEDYYVSFNAFEWNFDVVFIGPEDITNKQQDIRKV